jgi:hypothetical protein
VIVIAVYCEKRMGFVPLLPEAFKGVKHIGVIGWGSQVSHLLLDWIY